MRPQPLGTLTLLVVEDEPLVRELTVALLEAQGFAVVSAPSPSAAIELFGRDPACFDLVLTDVVMPGMNGRELARRLLSLRPDLPVVFMSGYADGVLDGPAPAASELHLLAKPFGRAELLAAISTAMGEQADGQLAAGSRMRNVVPIPGAVSTSMLPPL